MNPPDSTAELLELCDRLLEGQLTERERERLESLVLNDPKLRERYVETMHLHASLTQNRSRLADVSYEDVFRGLPEEFDEDATGSSNWILQIAAGVAIAAGIWVFASLDGSSRSVATLVETNAASWGSSS